MYWIHIYTTWNTDVSSKDYNLRKILAKFSVMSLWNRQLIGTERLRIHYHKKLYTYSIMLYYNKVGIKKKNIKRNTINFILFLPSLPSKDDLTKKEKKR